MRPTIPPPSRPPVKVPPVYLELNPGLHRRLTAGPIHSADGPPDIRLPLPVATRPLESTVARSRELVEHFGAPPGFATRVARLEASDFGPLIAEAVAEVMQRMTDPTAGAGTTHLLTAQERRALTRSPKIRMAQLRRLAKELPARRASFAANHEAAARAAAEEALTKERGRILATGHVLYLPDWRHEAYGDWWAGEAGRRYADARLGIIPLPPGGGVTADYCREVAIHVDAFSLVIVAQDPQVPPGALRAVLSGAIAGLVYCCIGARRLSRERELAAFPGPALARAIDQAVAYAAQERRVSFDHAAEAWRRQLQVATRSDPGQRQPLDRLAADRDACLRAVDAYGPALRRESWRDNG